MKWIISREKFICQNFKKSQRKALIIRFDLHNSYNKRKIGLEYHIHILVSLLNKMSSIIDLLSLISLNGFLPFEFFSNTKKIYEYTSFDKKYITLGYVGLNRSIL